MKSFRAVATLSVVVLSAGVMLSQGVQPAPDVSPLPALLARHHAWTTPPASIEIDGVSTHRKITEPVKITATRLEEELTEYESSGRLVATPDSFFKENGGKLTREPTRTGFSQMDITGLFYLAQLAQRPLTAGPPQRVAGQNGDLYRIHIDNHRTETHYARLKVSDEFDLYLDGNGLLAGISRSFYQDAKPFDFTLAYAFSDYRETNGVLLPYHIEKFLKGQKIETIDVTGYTIDVPTTPALFQPAGARVGPLGQNQ
jgi:hypothetical protein